MPAVFILPLAVTGMIGAFGWPVLFEAQGGLCGIVCLSLTAACFIKDKGLVTDLALIGIFSLLHISYGVETILGILE